MIVTLKAIYVNDTKPNGEPLITKKGDPYWKVVLDTQESGQMSKLFNNQDMIPKWNKGDKVNVEIKTSGQWVNWDFPKVKPGESPYSMQPENSPPESYEGAFNTSQKHNPVQNYETAKTVFKPKEDKPDWDAIAEGKVRHGVAIAFVERGIALSEDTKKQVNEWTAYIMTGK